MQDDTADPGSATADPAALLRATRILERKLLRSEASRVELEESKDRTDALYRNVLRETEEQSALLAEKIRMLEALSSKLSKYLAPQVYQSIFSGRQDVSLDTKRKKLTVFFSDLKDFTQITDDLEAEELTALLNEYFTDMSRIALEHGATIDKFVGDAMLMFFGDPETRGVREDAVACVSMAIAMQRRMGELQRLWSRRGVVKPLRMRIGINTGYCNVGNFGSTDRMDYTIIGGEVNLAARLESRADPDGILLSPETYTLVRDTFTAEEWPAIEVKGIRREIRPYALTNFLDETESGHIIRAETEGMSLRIDLRNLDADGRNEILRELGHITDQLQQPTDLAATAQHDPDGNTAPYGRDTDATG